MITMTASRSGRNLAASYVDSAEVAVRDSRVIVVGNQDAIAIQADLRAPREILDHPAVNTLLAFPSRSRC